MLSNFQEKGPIAYWFRIFVSHCVMCTENIIIRYFMGKYITVGTLLKFVEFGHRNSKTFEMVEKTFFSNFTSFRDSYDNIIYSIWK